MAITLNSNTNSIELNNVPALDLSNLANGDSIVTTADTGTVSATMLATGVIGTGAGIDAFVPFNNAILSSGASGTFTLSKRSKCLFSFGGSSFKTSGTGMTLTLAVTTIGTIAQIYWYTNETGSHKASPPGYGIQTLDAGTWTVTLTSDANVDNNDRGSCSILAIPTT
jgi:hypothetical protein